MLVADDIWVGSPSFLVFTQKITARTEEHFSRRSVRASPNSTQDEQPAVWCRPRLVPTGILCRTGALARPLPDASPTGGLGGQLRASTGAGPAGPRSPPGNPSHFPNVTPPTPEDQHPPDASSG